MSTSLLASPQTWDFNGMGDSDLNWFDDGQNWANYLQLSQGDITVQIAGISTTDGGDYEFGKLAFYGDTLGLINDNETGYTPDHSVDSYNGYFDAILLNFSEEVDLNGFGIGWAREDYNTNGTTNNADISIAAHTSTAFDLNGSDWKDVSNWSSINNYSNVGQYSYTSIDSSTVKSKQWLVSVYNPAFGSDGWTLGNDGFKLKSFNTNNPQPRTSVPEPGTLAIFALGLLALCRLRARNS